MTICMAWVLSLAPCAKAELPAIKPVGQPAPEGAPNVLLVLLDDVGFAAASTFGGPVPTPNYEALAAQGLRYNRFHTTAMCSPTRAALLTGRNHHRVEMGGIVNLAFGEEGYTSVIPKSAATLGRLLQLNGYSTAWLGKNHLTPDWEIAPSGPFDRWPNGLGFDYYYGFMGGATDQFAPNLLRQQHVLTPGKPFFLYLAPGTAHVPLQAPKEWIAKFRGKFDQGYDALRQETFERQKRLGVIPEDAELTPRPDSIPSWDDLTAEQKAVGARLMEVFAAQLSYFDVQFGRITDEIKRLGEWENTLVVYIDGDNGPDGASGLYGTMVEGLNGAPEHVDYMYEHLDEMGGPYSFNGYPAGWAWATASPFQYGKTIASHLGGTRDGLVVSWPRRIRDEGGLRSQFLHVTDITPTLLDAIGIAPPKIVDGVDQMTFDGVSFTDTFDDPDAPQRHTRQYFEMLGNRAYYEDGWMASTTPPTLPWARRPPPPPDDYAWELYHLADDFSQARNLATENPEKLKELEAAFRDAARANHVLPMNNNPVARQRDSSLKPYATLGRNHFEYYRGESFLPNAAFPDVRNRAWTLGVDLSMPDSAASGVLITQGGYDDGWGLFLFDGLPTFIYKANNLPGQQWRLTAGQLLAPGAHHVQLEIAPESGEPGAAATASLTVDGGAAVKARLGRTLPNTFTFSDGVGIGRDFRTALTREYELPFRFPGEIGMVTIDLE